jgi:chromosome segregation ATPase
LALLKRADSRWAKDRADDPAPVEYLQHLATYLQPVAPNADAAPAVDERELNMLREQAAAAETNAAARRAELDQARAQIDELSQQVETEHREALRAIGALESARLERDQLAEQLAEARNHTCPAPADDTEQQTARIAELETAAIENIKLIGELRADYDAAAADTQKLADELAAMRADRDALVARVVAADQHHCTWQWHGPDEPVKPCSCGRAAPRYELREVS